MSLKPKEFEEIIAKRFGEVKDGSSFNVSDLETYVQKVNENDKEKKEKAEKELAELLAKRQKPTLVCKNPQCRNDSEIDFEKDEKVAQVTCKRCGTVALERQIHDGEWVRQFEGEVNPSMHGPPPNHNFSSGHNLQTGMIEAIGGKRQAKELAIAQKNVEMNLSNMMDSRKEKRTRVGYKDQMKERMFELMREVGDSIQLHPVVIERAETLFARIRDDTEQLTNKYEVAAACLILAFREKLVEEGEAFTTMKASSNSSKPSAAPVLEFRCKYCNFPFSLKRDKIFHQKTCEDKPKTEERDAKS